MSQISRANNSDSETPLVILRPAKGWSMINFRDLWLFRELIYFMTWRDLKVRYKQTLLGFSWAIIKPFMTMVVFSIIFGKLAKMDSGGLPYPIFYYTALLPWDLFTNALSIASRSLVQNSNMITKIYFPRIILPLSSVLAGLADFAIAFLVLIGMMIFYKIPVTPRVWFLPLFLLLTVLTSLGVGLWLSAMNVLYRDINYITPFLTQFWWVVTPIAYSTSIFTGRWSSVLALNPMTGVIEGFRWSLLNTTQPLSIPTILVSALISLVVLVTGILYFRRMERLFADMV